MIDCLVCFTVTPLSKLPKLKFKFSVCHRPFRQQMEPLSKPTVEKLKKVCWSKASTCRLKKIVKQIVVSFKNLTFCHNYIIFSILSHLKNNMTFVQMFVGKARNPRVEHLAPFQVLHSGRLWPHSKH
jgi:hypothetical protein